MLVSLLIACAAEPAGSVVLRGGVVVGRGPADVWMRDGRIEAVDAGVSAPGAQEIDVSGRFIAPSFVDAHVHLTYLPRADALADGGVGAAVDWAAPIGSLGAPAGPLALVGSGPMLTAPGGYPTQGWGRDGYGLEVVDPASAVDAVDRLKARGAGVIKLAITTGPTPDDATLTAAIGRARELGLPVGAHALSDSDARRAARLGVDVLVHTPTAELSDEAVQLWSTRAVISTLDAFGASPRAIDNLRRLREAGATVLYGTDFGNARTAGISRPEIEALRAAGLDGAAILTAGTTAPAERFGLPVGIRPGAPASLLVLAADPTVDPLQLAAPEQVWIAGRPR